jgi:hypothetical protein
MFTLALGTVIGFIICFIAVLMLTYLAPDKVVKFAAKRGPRLERKLGPTASKTLRSIIERL